MPTAVTISILQMLRLKRAKKEADGRKRRHWGQTVTETFKAWALLPVQFLMHDPQEHQGETDSVIKPAAHSKQLCHPPATVLNGQEAASLAVLGGHSPPLTPPKSHPSVFPTVAQQRFCSPDGKSVVSSGQHPSIPLSSSLMFCSYLTWRPYPVFQTLLVLKTSVFANWP